jgi:7-carboxy-7-deazaguanine synthase
MNNLITYSEMFHSLQGEGVLTGHNTAWLRLFNCNLDCAGFLQKDPTNPDTYDLPYKDFDATSVSSLEDLPVWSKGCDSSYSWAVKFKHLNYQDTAEEIARKLMNMLTTETNPYGTFLHEKSGQETHMCFTGGEPLLPRNQRAIISILEALKLFKGGPVVGTQFHLASNTPRHITFETNGTQFLTQDTVKYFTNRGLFNSEILFSVSPKLFTVSGERGEKAIKPDVVVQYQDISSFGQLKFVVGTEQRQWDELEHVIDLFREAGVKYPVWLMPVGALEEQQTDIAAQVSDMALARGYNVSARVHTYIYGNKIGT